MKLGSETVSGDQLQHLANAREYQSRGVTTGLLRTFERILTDEDITSERETVHPEWLELIIATRERWERVADPKLRARLVEFIDAHSFPYDKLSRIDPANARLTFLLGAGASKPAPSGIPTVKELLPHMLERGARLDRDDVNRLADYCSSNRINNIEDLLTAAQLSVFCSKNPTVLGLMNHLLYQEAEQAVGRSLYGLTGGSRPSLRGDVSSMSSLQDTLQVLFGLLSNVMLPAEPNTAHKAIAEYALKRSNVSIITTNYDCCIDLALGADKDSISYGLEFKGLSNAENAGRSVVRLLKLHGSLNWYYCDTCQSIQNVSIRTVVENFRDDRSPYAVIGICRDCGGPRRGLVVPPLSMKFDVAAPLSVLLSEVRTALDSTDFIVAIGFSFAEADLYITRLLSKSMQTDLSRRLLIVDPDATVASRMKNRLRRTVPNFDPDRVIGLVGDCTEIVPKFLSGGYLQAGEVRPPVTGTKTTTRRVRVRPANVGPAK